MIYFYLMTIKLFYISIKLNLNNKTFLFYYTVMIDKTENSGILLVLFTVFVIYINNIATHVKMFLSSDEIFTNRITK